MLANLPFSVFGWRAVNLEPKQKQLLDVIRKNMLTLFHQVPTLVLM